jgi:hypothetical protein
MRIRPWLFTGVSAAVVALAATAATARAEAAGPQEVKVAPGSAEGFIKLDGKPYPIKHSYALAVGGGYWLLLTDVAVPDASFQGPRALRALGFDGKTHGLLVTIDAQGTPNPVMILQGVEATGDLSWQELELSKFSKSELEGKIHTRKPHDSDAGSFTKGEGQAVPKTFEYDISFKAPVNDVARH